MLGLMARFILKIHTMSPFSLCCGKVNTHIVSVRVGLGAEEGKEVRLDVTRNLLYSLLAEHPGRPSPVSAFTLPDTLPYLH